MSLLKAMGGDIVRAVQVLRQTCGKGCSRGIEWIYARYKRGTVASSLQTRTSGDFGYKCP